MRYTLIIPAWNEAAYLPRTLTAVALAMEGCSHEGVVIVVDNNSSDNTAEVAQAAGASVVYEPINQIARARNAGAAAADTDALIFLDADTEITAELLTSALDALATGTVAGGGVIIEMDKPPRKTAALVLKLWNTVSKRLKLAAGSFVYCRRDAFDAIGGFDTKVYAAEELVFSRRLKRWGRKNNMTFNVITDQRIVTSSRKLDWYSTPELLWQFLLVMIPGAVYSKRMCRTWYDKDKARS